MTIGFGAKIASGVVVIADSRVTWPTRHNRDFSDNLQKLYVLGSGSVICFAGDVDIAREMLRDLSENVFHTDDIRSLKDNVGPFLRNCYSQLRSEACVEFLLGGVHREGYMVKYTSPDFDADSISPWLGYHIIGSGEVIRPALPIMEKQFLDLAIYSDGEAVCHTAIFTSHIRNLLRNLRVDTVGGLLQIAFIGEKGISFLSDGLRTVGRPGGDVDYCMNFKDGRFVQRNNKTGQEIVLKTVFDHLPKEEVFRRDS